MEKTTAGTDATLTTTHSSTQDESSTKAHTQPWSRRFCSTLMEPGSALQIVIAAAIAIGIGMAVTSTVDDIPEAAPVILEIPGSLWLRALRATGQSPTSKLAVLC